MPREPTVDDLLLRLERIHIEEAEIVEQIKQARLRERQRTTVAVAIPVPIAPAADSFRVGQRVRIINDSDHPQGVVTRVTAKRVYVQTNDGPPKCRAPKNLRLV